MSASRASARMCQLLATASRVATSSTCKAGNKISQQLAFAKGAKPSLGVRQAAFQQEPFAMRYAAERNALKFCRRINDGAEREADAPHPTPPPPHLASSASLPCGIKHQIPAGAPSVIRGDGRGGRERNSGGNGAFHFAAGIRGALHGRVGCVAELLQIDIMHGVVPVINPSCFVILCNRGRCAR